MRALILLATGTPILYLGILRALPPAAPARSQDLTALPSAARRAHRATAGSREPADREQGERAGEAPAPTAADAQSNPESIDCALGAVVAGTGSTADSPLRARCSFSVKVLDRRVHRSGLRRGGGEGGGGESYGDG